VPAPAVGTGVGGPRRLPGLVLLLMLVLASGPLPAQTERARHWLEQVTSAYRDRTGIETRPGLGMHEAAWVRSQLTERLRPELGGIFGYKAALTSAAARERFDADEPVMGILLEGMIRNDGATVSLAEGVQLMVEADLLVRVADAAVNQAQTPGDAFDAIDRVAPFIEIADIVFEPDQLLTSPMLTAANAGARLGVMGPQIPVAALHREALRTFSVTLLRDGKRAAPEARGTALLGDPMESVLWLARRARERGFALQPGQWLSLGSLTPPQPARAGSSYRAVYRGLGPDTLGIEVSVTP